ncbi:MAG: hypothetical protein R3C52_03060 [Hyphomonadaceae bacterium]
MRHALLLALSTAVLAAPVVVSTAVAQAAPDAYVAPRTAFGQPDISGVWSNASLTPFTRSKEYGDRLAFTEAEVKEMEHAAVQEVIDGNKPTDPNAGAEFRQQAEEELRPEFRAAGGAVGGYNRGWLDPGASVMRVNGEPRTSVLTTPDGQFPKRRANATPPKPTGPRIPMGSYESYETRSLGERCIIGFGRNGGPPMLANGFYNNNYQIVQSPEAIVIETEMNHDARIVRLNAKHRTDDIRPYFGDSIGWWDGDTLVVETTNIPESQAFGGSWKNLKVTERFRRVGDERLYYGFTVEDPDLWDKPWGGEYEFIPLHGPIYEYACHEGNYALPGILSGGRAVEDKAEAKKAAAKK